MSDSQKPPLNDARTWSLMRRLLREAVKPYLGHLFFAVIFMVVVAGSTAATAWLLEPAIDEVFVAKDPEMLWSTSTRSWRVCTKSQCVGCWSH